MHRYESLVSLIHEWVAGGILKPGDRVPSVREMSAKLGYSAVTVYHAYGILEDEGILQSRPRSGFFVSKVARPLPEFTSAAPTDYSAVEDLQPIEIDIGPLPPNISRVMEGSGFGSPGVSRDLLPYGDLYRLLQSNLRWELAKDEPVPWQGAAELREVIGKRPGVLSPGMSVNDIVVSSSLDSALTLALEVLTKPGDKVLMETPTDPSCVDVALRRNLNIVEIYSHPRFGIDPDQMLYLLEQNDIAVCILETSNHSPTGVSYSQDVVKRVADVAARTGVPTIEITARQELNYAANAGISLSMFDTGNLVVRVGGFAETLGASFGLGWTAFPRRGQSQIARQFSNRPMLAGEVAMQRAIAEYLGRRSYERHLRKLRESLSARMRRGLSTLFQHFPENCTVSRPQGGYFCWVRGPKHFNAVAAVQRTLDAGASFAPGPLFSVTRSFGNFLALNLSHSWTAEREEQIAHISRLLREANSNAA